MDLEAAYQQIRDEAEEAAGELGQLRFRAKGYLQIYQASNGVCRFSLIAAHGALWASWYLICAQMAAAIFAVFLPTITLSKRLSIKEKFTQFSNYVLTLREINKLVMVETYVLIHTIQRLGVDFAISKNIPPALARDYDRAMRQSKNWEEGTSPKKIDNDDQSDGHDKREELLRDLYHRHFLWEQERVVSDKLMQAFAGFTWPFMRDLCQRPWVWFSYFRTGKSLNFRNFTDPEERLEKGLISYERAVEFGLARLSKVTMIRLKILPGTSCIENSKPVNLPFG